MCVCVCVCVNPPSPQAFCRELPDGLVPASMFTEGIEVAQRVLQVEAHKHRLRLCSLAAGHHAENDTTCPLSLHCFSFFFQPFPPHRKQWKCFAAASATAAGCVVSGNFLEESWTCGLLHSSLITVVSDFRVCNIVHFCAEYMERCELCVFVCARL